MIGMTMCEPVYDLTEEITPPRITHKVNPERGPNARGVRIVGSVIVGVIVTSQGLPRDVHLVKGLEKSVDESALAAVEEVGMPATETVLKVYGAHIEAIAQAELAAMPGGDRVAAVEYAVLGTILYEPVIAALRRLAHQNITARRRLGGEPAT